MAWNESTKNVTRAFDAWKLVNRDIAAFLNVELRFVRKGYQDTWDEVGHRPATEDSVWPDAFEAEVDLLWPQEFEWMFLAAIVKDSVTAFEVYLEQAAMEVLGFHGLAFRNKKPDRSLPWDKIRLFFEQFLGLKLDDERIRQIRTLRHLLTHRRGELRTEHERQLFGQGEDGSPTIEAILTEESVRAILYDLSVYVRNIDTHAYRLSWGGERITNLSSCPIDPESDDR